MGISFVPRAGWGARKPRGTTRLNATKPTSVHWNGPTVTVSGRTTWTHDKCAGLIRGIQNYHMDAKGWQDIAYNFVACPHGVVFEGRGSNVRSAANGTNDGNASSHAVVCLAGEGNPFGDSEKKALRDCRDFVARGTSAPGGLMCHSDHKSTECPGDARRAWVRGGQGGGSGGPASQPPSSSSPPTQRRGDRGPYVRVIQTILRDRAGRSELTVDGDFGPRTENAVKDLQRIFDLTVDGVVGPKTWGALHFINS